MGLVNKGYVIIRVYFCKLTPALHLLFLEYIQVNERVSPVPKGPKTATRWSLRRGREEWKGEKEEGFSTVSEVVISHGLMTGFRCVDKSGHTW